jgi:hypothetical protein
MKQHTRRLLAISGILFGLMWSGVSGAAQGITVLEPGITHFDKSYNQLAGDWWNWAVRFPLATNPLVEDGVVDCTRGQKGKIWFLAGNFGGTSTRTCTIPDDKALFFPVINTIWWVPEDGDNAAEVRILANANINSTSALEVSIDGVVISDPFAYRAQSQPGGFALKFGPQLADFGFGPTPDPRNPAVADGYWILLAPLREGKHIIKFSSSNPPQAFELDVTYQLTVGEDDNER